MQSKNYAIFSKYNLLSNQHNTKNARIDEVNDNFCATVEDISDDDWHYIYTADDMSNIRNNLSGNYKLMNYIDLDNNEWNPIGYIDSYYIYPFKGILDGNNHTIENLKITK